MPTATTIVQICDAITASLREQGFFEADREDSARADMLEPAVRSAADELGLDLKLSNAHDAKASTVMVEGVPGVVTIVAQRRIGDGTPEDGHDSVNPDFGVTWALA